MDKGELWAFVSEWARAWIAAAQIWCERARNGLVMCVRVRVLRECELGETHKSQTHEDGEEDTESKTRVQEGYPFCGPLTDPLRSRN